MQYSLHEKGPNDKIYRTLDIDEESDHRMKKKLNDIILFALDMNWGCSRTFPNKDEGGQILIMEGWFTTHCGKCGEYNLTHYRLIKLK